MEFPATLLTKEVVAMDMNAIVKIYVVSATTTPTVKSAINTPVQSYFASSYRVTRVENLTIKVPVVQQTGISGPAEWYYIFEVLEDGQTKPYMKYFKPTAFDFPRFVLTALPTPARNLYQTVPSAPDPSGSPPMEWVVEGGMIKWRNSDGTWSDLIAISALQGPEGHGTPGDPGIPGSPGRSTYQLAIESGYSGTVEEWLADQKGAPGEPGRPGDKGNPGGKGDPGKSAYEVWLAQGNSGSESAFLNAQKGGKGDTGGVGKSTYQTWLDAGNAGSEAVFLASLKGAKGDTGTFSGTAASDIEISVIGKGLVLKSPDGKRWRITPSNAGATTWEQIV